LRVRLHDVPRANCSHVKGGPNAKQPAIKAVARGGAEVTVKWSNIIRMHRGPILTVIYFGYV
jgi:hypothetical protein